MKQKFLSKVYQFKNDLMLRFAGLGEREDGDHLLEVLGVIIIAVVLLIIFRQQIVDLFQAAMSTTSDKVNSLWGDATTTTTTPTADPANGG